MDKLNAKRILVTGGNGYLGTHLIRALEKHGAEVHILDQTKSSAKHSWEVDITRPEEIKKAVESIRPEIIFHLAASLNRDRDFAHHDAVMKINYEGTLNLLQTLQPFAYNNFIFTSTSEIYGSNKAPFRENQLPAPASPYSLSKTCAEQAIRTWSELYKKDFTILRLFNFFGPEMPPRFFIPQLIHSLKNDQVFKMTPGKQKRDFLYIDDVVQALLLAATKQIAKNKTYNVSSGKSVTLRQLVVQFRQHLKSSCHIDAGALPYRENEIWNMVGSNRKIKKELRFKPQFTLAAAIQKVISSPQSNAPFIFAIK